MQTALPLDPAPAAAADAPDAPPRVYVAVAGNIGAGKSSLTAVLAEYFHWDPFYERVDDNPYLSDFYAEMQRWSFHLQVQVLRSDGAVLPLRHSDVGVLKHAARLE